MSSEQVVHGTAHHLGEVDVRQHERGPCGTLGGELDQSFHHAQQPVGAGLHPLDQVLALVVVLGVADGVDEALERRDRSAEVVAEGRVERVLRILERLQVGEVAGDLREAGEVALASRGWR